MWPRRLSQEELEVACRAIPAWTLRGQRLHRAMRFESFQRAFAFMDVMAAVSEAMNHHPEWRNTFRDLEIELTTHDAGGVTELDVKWAQRADQELAKQASG
jgi:4a-hydroxytetrahydrobiopterin dehydratase